MSESLGRTLFRLGFEISPIIFTGGIAGEGPGGFGIPGGMLPIVAITEALNFVEGLLGGGSDLSLDNFFAHFRVLPGGTLVSNQLGTYPFANQAVAANAIIAQPLNVSLLMVCPVKSPGGYLAKLATIMALQAAVSLHNANGGTYTIATPSFLYTDCIMTGMKDVSSGETRQAQVSWQFDFTKPLVTLQDAQSAMGQLMSKLTNGQVTDGSLSGAPQTAGNVLSGASPATAPASQNLAGTGVSSFPSASRLSSGFGV